MDFFPHTSTSLTDGHDDTLAVIKTYRSPFIHTLPFELLDYIFDRCGRSISLGDKLPIPFSISQVCVRWRQHVLHSSKFWSSYVIVDANSPAIMKSQLELCLKRSQRSLLSFSFDSTFITPELNSIATILLSQVDRWNSISIPASLFLSALSRVEVEPLPYLEKLRVMGGEGYAMELCMPNITHLCVHNAVYPAIPPFFHLEKLSHLQLNYCTITMMDFFSLLESAQNIHSMELVPVELVGTYTGSNTDKIRLENLTSLSLAMSYSDTSLALDSIIAPRLRTLVIYSLTSRPITYISQSVKTFVQDSKFALRELTLCNFPLAVFLQEKNAFRFVKVLRVGHTKPQGGEEMIVRLLKTLPGLESFSLWYDQEYDDKVFAGLVPFIERDSQNIRQVSLSRVETNEIEMEVLLSCNLPSESWCI